MTPYTQNYLCNTIAAFPYFDQFMIRKTNSRVFLNMQMYSNNVIVSPSTFGQLNLIIMSRRRRKVVLFYRSFFVLKKQGKEMY